MKKKISKDTLAIGMELTYLSVPQLTARVIKINKKSFMVQTVQLDPDGKLGELIEVRFPYIDAGRLFRFKTVPKFIDIVFLRYNDAFCFKGGTRVYWYKGLYNNGETVKYCDVHNKMYEISAIFPAKYVRRIIE